MQPPVVKWEAASSTDVIEKTIRKLRKQATGQTTNSLKKPRRSMHKAEWEYINNTITQGVQTNNSKPFWKYIESIKQDNIGVTPLKKNGSLVCDSKEKAEILLDQFQSVFTRDGGSAPPYLDPSQHPVMSDININSAGVCKLFITINRHKACGPHQIPNVILKNYADTLAQHSVTSSNSHWTQPSYPQTGALQTCRPFFFFLNIRL